MSLLWVNLAPDFVTLILFQNFLIVLIFPCIPGLVLGRGMTPRGLALRWYLSLPVGWCYKTKHSSQDEVKESIMPGNGFLIRSQLEQTRVNERPTAKLESSICNVKWNNISIVLEQLLGALLPRLYEQWHFSMRSFVCNEPFCIFYSMILLFTC